RTGGSPAITSAPPSRSSASAGPALSSSTSPPPPPRSKPAAPRHKRGARSVSEGRGRAPRLRFGLCKDSASLRDVPDQAQADAEGRLLPVRLRLLAGVQHPVRVGDPLGLLVVDLLRLRRRLCARVEQHHRRR